MKLQFLFRRIHWDVVDFGFRSIIKGPYFYTSNSDSGVDLLMFNKKQISELLKRLA
ncbi:hypothetical protein LCGC14_2248710 [marine sediment metagenome]|uniref:Uncharacterized protein n=1 Tax=marine sediment metagenome TaxID=412755 RepID=A0A0F9D3H6_9ZZZZ